MFRLKILWRGLDLGKCKSISERKRLPIFVSTFLLYGGLYQMMFCGRFLRALVSLWDSLYARLTCKHLTKAATSIMFANCGHMLCKLHLIWNKLVVVVVVLNNESEISHEYPRTFVERHEISLRSLRNFGLTNFAGAKIRTCQIWGKRKLADTVYDANRLNQSKTESVCVCVTLSRLVNENWLNELHVDRSILVEDGKLNGSRKENMHESKWTQNEVSGH